MCWTDIVCECNAANGLVVSAFGASFPCSFALVVPCSTTTRPFILSLSSGLVVEKRIRATDNGDDPDKMGRNPSDLGVDEKSSTPSHRFPQDSMIALTHRKFLAFIFDSTALRYRRSIDLEEMMRNRTMGGQPSEG